MALEVWLPAGAAVASVNAVLQTIPVGAQVAAASKIAGAAVSKEVAHTISSATAAAVLSEVKEVAVLSEAAVVELGQRLAHPSARHLSRFYGYPSP